MALAAVLAWYLPARTAARNRVNANALWAIVVVMLNVPALPLIGLQAHAILRQLQGQELPQMLNFAGMVPAVLIGVRFIGVMAYGYILRWVRSFFVRRVLGTLIIQGLTIRPLIALLRIAPDSSFDKGIADLRREWSDYPHLRGPRMPTSEWGRDARDDSFL